MVSSISRIRGPTAAATLHFGRKFSDNLTAFIAELRPGQTLNCLGRIVIDWTALILPLLTEWLKLKGISGMLKNRSWAIAEGIKSVHEFFRSTGDGAQAVLMSPVNEAATNREHQPHSHLLVDSSEWRSEVGSYF